jgi:hypothetical protein
MTEQSTAIFTHVNFMHKWAARAGATVLWYVSTSRQVVSFGILLAPERHAVCQEILRGEFLMIGGICLN